MGAKIEFTVRNFLRIKSASVVSEAPLKVLLYGPNGGGKSSTMYALMLVTLGDEGLAHLEVVDDVYIARVKEGAEVLLKLGDKVLGCVKGKYVCGDSGSSVFEAIRPCVSDLLSMVGINRIAFVRSDTAYYTVLGGRFEEYDIYTTLDSIVEDKEELENLGLTTTWAELIDVYDVSRGKLKTYIDEEPRWIPLKLLAYGFRRAMLITYLVEKADLILIEGFEAGLHVDLVHALLEWLNKKTKHVVIETHSGLALKKALDFKWNVYYVSNGDAIKVTFESLDNVDMFKREIEAYIR